MNPLAPIDPQVLAALDPNHSVVVEACAGSGKTWLLVSRIVRLLLAGSAPAEILAITFTRKAAQEMQARLNDWLRHLATASEPQVREFLRQRALSDDEITRCLPEARRLYELTLHSRPQITINTFHGWFLDLLQHAPLQTGASGRVALLEQTLPLIDEAWQALAEQLHAAPDSTAAHSLTTLFRDYGLSNTRVLLQRFITHRAEWWTYTQGEADPTAFALERLSDELGIRFDQEILPPLFADEVLIAALERFADLLAQRDTQEDPKFALQIQAALACTDVEARFNYLLPIFFTAKGAPRIRKLSLALSKNLGAENAERFMHLHEHIVQRLSDAKLQRTEHSALCFNRDVLISGQALLQHYQDLKHARGVLDFTDIEYGAHTLLTESDHAAYMQYKLDARYRHILLDEFQDTNPLQWQILKSWFDAAVEAGRSPRIFVVGDPKQSIYRFRGADARLFELACDYLKTQFQAAHLTQHESWRNAQPVLDTVNQLFAAEPLFTHFQAHQARQRSLPGQVYLLPLEAKPEANSVSTALRNPLTTPLVEASTSTHQREAEHIAAGIQSIVGHWAIMDKGVRRLATYRDIILLTRMRTHLRVYEEALKQAGIPFLTSRKGGLLETLEARDLSVLLEFLVLPCADLKLAHILRTPLFNASDEDLLALAVHRSAEKSDEDAGSWWLRLCRLVASGKASPALHRAYALLNTWRCHTDQLPVHDLLDRIYHEGDVLACYQRTVPAMMADAVQANLLRFLELSLTLEGGRYPSLPKFIDALNLLRRGGDTEAPDEGQAADAENAVHLYTVHGAKGLERPIVWLLNANAVAPPRDAYSTLVDWQPGAQTPQHFSFASTQEARGQARSKHFEREAQLLAREELNLLYVAMTRAQQYLIVSGAEANATQNSSWYARLARVVTPNSALTPPDCARVTTAAITDRAPGINIEVELQLLRNAPACGQRSRRIETPAMRHGTLLHRLLEQLTPPTPAKDKARLQQNWGITAEAFEMLWEEAQAILRAPHLMHYFDPTHYQRAWNELPFLNAKGEFLRIDRLVEFEHEIWVLDYKSTEPTSPETLSQSAQPHRAQLKNYMQAMQTLFPGKQMKGGLIFKEGLLFVIDSSE